MMRTPFWDTAKLVAESMGTDVSGVLSEMKKYRERIQRRARYAHQKSNGLTNGQEGSTLVAVGRAGRPRLEVDK